MADRPNSSISKQLLEKSKNARNGKHPAPVQDLEPIIELIETLNLAHKNNSWPSVSEARHWHGSLLNFKQYYDMLYKYYSEVTSEESIINRIETKAAWRNLIFRVGTTALVALTLGGAYSIAGNSDSLYLPLQQKSITYYYEGKHHPIPPADPTKYEEPKKVVTVIGKAKGKHLSIAGAP